MSDLLVPFDFSKNAIKALDQAILISSVNHKKIEVLHITNESVSRQYPKNWKYNGDIKILKEKLESVVEERKELLGASAKTGLLVKEAATISGGIISRMLQGKLKLLVMGTHGSSGVYDKVFGTNTAVMVNHSIFPILVIPHNWKPVVIDHCVTVIKLNKLSSVSKRLKAWGKFFSSSVEAVQFTILKEAEGTYAKKEQIDGIPCRIILNPIETPLAQDVLNFTRKLRSSLVILFTKEKTFLEKLFLNNLTYKLSGSITIPLLAIPYEETGS